MQAVSSFSGSAEVEVNLCKFKMSSGFKVDVYADVPNARDKNVYAIVDNNNWGHPFINQFIKSNKGTIQKRVRGFAFF